MEIYVAQAIDASWLGISKPGGPAAWRLGGRVPSSLSLPLKHTGGDHATKKYYRFEVNFSVLDADFGDAYIRTSLGYDESGVKSMSLTLQVMTAAMIDRLS